ncbi:MAG: hypothetical protein ACRENH_04480 [Gemmatimonadaceae bacterium]
MNAHPSWPLREVERSEAQASPKGGVTRQAVGARRLPQPLLTANRARRPQSVSVAEGDAPPNMAAVIAFSLIHYVIQADVRHRYPLQGLLLLAACACALDVMRRIGRSWLASDAR